MLTRGTSRAQGMGLAANHLHLFLPRNHLLQTWVCHFPSLSFAFLIVGDRGAAGLASPPPPRAKSAPCLRR